MSEPKFKPKYQHPAEIWLQPWCRECEDTGDERVWAPHNEWADEPCDGCGAKSVRYVIARAEGRDND